MKGKLFAVTSNNAFFILKMLVGLSLVSITIVKRKDLSFLNLAAFSKTLFSFDFPCPTGPYAVGATSYTIKDFSRKEELSEREDVRTLAIHVWYPAEGKLEKSKERYLEMAMPYLQAEGARQYYIPHFVTDFLFRDMHSYAQRDVPLACEKKQYPIIIFSHGFGSLAEIHTVTLEELASHGYVVVGIDHTYDCRVTVLDNGKIIPFYSQWESRLLHVCRRITTWIKDIRFVLDVIEGIAKKDSATIFAGRLDLTSIGVLGHSMGGAAAVQAAQLDERIKACVNMDGPLLGRNRKSKNVKPCMFLFAEESVKQASRPLTEQERILLQLTPSEEQLIKYYYLGATHALLKNTKNDMYVFELKGAGHNTFTDCVLLKNVSRFFSLFDLGIGTVDPQQSITIVNSYIRDFFNKYLKNMPITELNKQHGGVKTIAVKNGNKSTIPLSSSVTLVS